MTETQSPTARTRVLYAGPRPPPLGGMATYTEQYLASDVARVCSVRFLNTDRLGKHRFRGPSRLVANLLNASLLQLRVLSELVAHRPDIVHIATNSFAGFYEKALLGLTARCRGCRVVLHVHGAQFEDFVAQAPRVLKPLLRFLARSADRLIVLHSGVRASLESLGVPTDRITILPNAVPAPRVTAARERVPPQAEGPDARRPATILFLSRLHPSKGIHVLLEAMGRIRARHPRVRCVMHGPESTETRSIRARITGEGLDGHVQVPGPVCGKDKEAAFADADIYVLPSLAEGLPVALLEAMAHGLPCVATCV
jgi:glycosyltransferase involved in cell wall biosynthesis